MKPRIVAFSISSLEPLLREVSLSLLAEAEIEIVGKAYEDALTYAQKRHQAETADVFIAAGSNGAYLQDVLSAPLVLVTVDGFDLMRCLADARKVSQRVGLVAYGEPYKEVQALCEAYSIDVQSRAYRTPEEAKIAVRDLVSLGCEVIVGPGLVNGLAAEYGVEHLLSYSQGSVLRAFREAIRLGRLQRGSFAGSAPVAANARPKRSTETLLGQSVSMQRVRELIQWYAPTEGSVFIQGQTGTGKELVAQAIHAQSSRNAQAFIALNCAALTESLLESELFGYEEGAFSGAVKGGRSGIFEAAHKGTVFLDEIGDMPLNFQSRLLRVLEERAVRRIGSTKIRATDFRLITATHVNLQANMRAGRFREDLYYRINELRLHLPSLAQRKEDLPLLVEYFLATSNPAPGVQRRRDFIELALPIFETYAWPGSVRELRQWCKRAAVFLGQSQPLGEKQLYAWFPELLEHSTVDPPALLPARKSLRYETALRAMQLHDNQAEAAARSLGVSRVTLWRMLKQK